jgi:trans-2,3-dihydro-3-hydroxyanthranilate isomerase
MRIFPFVQTSVFTDDRYSFGGNQLATLWSHQHNTLLTDEEMLGITREMNFSETTFVLKPTLENFAAKVRIFTPGKEIPFAGHPTVGTAYVLRHKRIIDTRVANAVLELGIGPTPVEFLNENSIRMTQKKPEFLNRIYIKAAVAEALGLDESDISNQFPMQFVSTGNPFLIVPIHSLSAVQNAVPNPVLIMNTLKDKTSQVIVILCTECVHEKSHVHVRMFAPFLGVLEDPATGSAAGPIGAYLERHNVIQNHKNGDALYIEQGYEMNRPSQLIFESIGGRNIERALVSGKVRLIAEGNLFLEG